MLYKFDASTRGRGRTIRYRDNAAKEKNANVRVDFFLGVYLHGTPNISKECIHLLVPRRGPPGYVGAKKGQYI